MCLEHAWKTKLAARAVVLLLSHHTKSGVV